MGSAKCRVGWWWGEVGFHWLHTCTRRHIMISFQRQVRPEHTETRAILLLSDQNDIGVR